MLSSSVTVGPILLGVDRPAHILTPSATVRRVVNMTAIAVVDAQRYERDRAGEPAASGVSG
jgi:malate dehydrogenase (oxaloacetate-decarboxylating)(NADP+)